MRISKHISFFYLESRIQYVDQIIRSTNLYSHPTDIFVHTNKEIWLASFDEYTNGKIHVVYHDLTGIDPFLLTWKCRDLLREQKDDYDIFMYIEDDILVPDKAVQYWLARSEALIAMNYNLGFLRIEVEDGVEYISDLLGENERFDCLVNLNDEAYCLNTKNPYCAFWIYSQKEFHRFLASPLYDIRNINGYHTREASAIGLHGNSNYWYRGTVIPMENNQLVDGCKIYHLPNNFVMNKHPDFVFGTIKFQDAFKPGFL